MALLKYTTEINVEKTVGQIMGKLQAAGAVSILTEYDDRTKEIKGIAFRIATPHGVMPYLLPADVARTTALLKKQAELGRVPKTALRQGQPARIVWRILYEWLESQLALIEIGSATLDQIMLPYTVMGNRSLYQVLQDGGMAKLLGSGEVR